jgi:hypothetical protein
MARASSVSRNGFRMTTAPGRSISSIVDRGDATFLRTQPGIDNDQVRSMADGSGHCVSVESCGGCLNAWVPGRAGDSAGGCQRCAE